MIFDWNSANEMGKKHLSLKCPIGLPPNTPVAQNIADQRWLIADSAKNRYFFI